MSEPRFDPGGFYEFDLDVGAMRTREGARVLVLSEDVLAPLISAAVYGGDLTPVRRLGTQLGQVVAAGLSDASKATPEEVISHVAGTLGMFGWGQVSMSRFGDAVVVRTESPPELDADHLGMAALLGGIFTELSDAEVACVPIEDGHVFMMVDPEIAETVWNWAKEGLGAGGIVERLVVTAGGESS